MDKKTELFLMRRKKGILLKEIAENIGCSIPLLSKYENDKSTMSVNLQVKYRDFIESY